jgi:hypothetical protein
MTCNRNDWKPQSRHLGRSGALGEPPEFQQLLSATL